MFCDFKGKVDNHNGDISEGSEEQINGIHLQVQRQTHTQPSYFMTKL